MKIKKLILNFFSGLFLVLMVVTVFFIALMMGGCTRTIYETVEKEVWRTDTLQMKKWHEKNIVERDTFNVYTRGDTIFRETTRWRIREVNNHDTLYQIKCDSVIVPRPYPVEKRVEVARPLSWWQKTTQGLGVCALVCLMLFAGWRILRRKIIR